VSNLTIPFSPVVLSSCLLSKNVKITIFKTVILPVVLYGHETWSLTLKEGHGPKKDEMTGERRKLHKEELRDL
jgi:hypothetical protein